MRVWLQKQKKKEEAKAAAAVATPVEVTPAASEVQPTGDPAENPVQSVEEDIKAESLPAEKADGSTDNGEASGQHAGMASVQPIDVGFLFIPTCPHIDMFESISQLPQGASRNDACLRKISRSVSHVLVTVD